MNGKPPSVMLFAAGFGTRMGALTKDCPKPLIKVAGKALIDHALALVQEIPVGTVVANTHYLADQMAEHLRPLGVAISSETPDILETGGGLKAALPLLGRDPVFTMNTDAIWAGPNPLQLLLDAWRPEHMDGLLMCVPVGSTTGYSGTGDFSIGADHRISRGHGHVYGGVQIIRTDLLGGIPERAFSLNRLWDVMLDRQRLFALNYPGRWSDVGHPAGIALAEGVLGKTHV